MPERIEARSSGSIGRPVSRASVSCAQTVLGIAHNFHWIVPDVAARSAQNYIGGLEHFLAARGIRSVINLRGAHPYWRWYSEETRVCEKLGLRHFDVALCSRKVPQPKLLVSLIESFDAAHRPFLIKCSGGTDRTSFAAALFVLHEDGWQRSQYARRQFARVPYLHFPRRDQRWAKRFIDYAAAEAQDAPLASWLAHAYEPARFSEWLRACD